MDEPGYNRFGSSVGVKLKLPRPKNCRGRRSGGPKNEHKMCRKVAGGRRMNQSALLVLSSSPGRRRDGAGSSGEEAAVGGPILRSTIVHDTDPSLRVAVARKRNECRAGRALCKVGLPRYVHTTPVTKAPKIKPQIDLLISLLAYYFRIKKLQRL